MWTPHHLPLLVALSFGSGCAATPAARGAAGPAESRAWTDDDEHAVALADFRGHPFVLSAIYTSCTVRCPLTISKLHELDEAFGARGARVPIVLVSLDPRTDTPARLHAFRAQRHLPDNWHLLSGSREDTMAIERALHVRLVNDDTHLDHDVRIAVFGSDGTLRRNYEGWSFDAAEAVAVW